MGTVSMHGWNTVDETTLVSDEGSSLGFLKRDDSAGPLTHSAYGAVALEAVAPDSNELTEATRR